MKAMRQNRLRPARNRTTTEAIRWHNLKSMKPRQFKKLLKTYFDFLYILMLNFQSFKSRIEENLVSPTEKCILIVILVDLVMPKQTMRFIFC